MDEHDALQRLEEAMDQARQDLDIKWVDVARLAGISTETLFRFRKGHRTPDTTRKIERAYGWGRGHVEAILNNDPLPEPQSTEPEPEPKRDSYDDLITRLDQLKTDLETLRDEKRRGA